jgi:hypothetical protein
VSPRDRHSDRHSDRHRTDESLSGLESRTSRALNTALDRAVSIPSAAVHGYVNRVRVHHPRATPQQLVSHLERQYLRTVTGSGGAVGVAAAAPGLGTGAGMAISAGEVAAFFGASALFSLAVASVHGIEVDDVARRRALLLATVLGDTGAELVRTEGGIPTTAWARVLLTSAPPGTIKRVNSMLAKRLVKRQVTKEGAFALGRLAPFGIGAVIGAVGGHAMGKTMVEGARRAFGPAPLSFQPAGPALESMTHRVIDQRHRVIEG